MFFNTLIAPSTEVRFYRFERNRGTSPIRAVHELTYYLYSLTEPSWKPMLASRAFQYVTSAVSSGGSYVPVAFPIFHARPDFFRFPFLAVSQPLRKLSSFHTGQDAAIR